MESGYLLINRRHDRYSIDTRQAKNNRCTRQKVIVNYFSVSWLYLD